jgi:choline dehydrogenase-like flavoprotein
MRSVFQPGSERADLPKDVEAYHWDVIVIGTGMGGGLAGRRLAEHGLSVLFVEKGPIGYRAETQYLRDDVVDYAARQIRGFWPTRIEASRS